jgi:hypothetical protein
MGDSISKWWTMNDSYDKKPRVTKRLKDISDPIVEDVKSLLTVRSKVGIAKYDTTLYDSKLTTLQWLQHLQEELLDGACYIERLKKDLDK